MNVQSFLIGPQFNEDSYVVVSLHQIRNMERCVMLL